jgi:hypothetical protein
MKQSAKLHDNSVDTYIRKLKEPLAQLVEALRKFILDADPQVGEQIKWNSPSFYYKGEMKHFDPKEYKRDIVVLNLHKKDSVVLVFPTGATVKDTTGFLEGDYKDGRRVARILDVKDARKKKKALQTVIRDWIELVDK